MYTPLNPAIFTAAFSGAFAGMAAAGKVNVDPNAASYADTADVAGAFAQEVDTLWGVTIASSQDISLMAQSCEGEWAGRSYDPLALTPADYAVMAQGVIAVIQAGKNYAATQGIIPDVPSSAVATLAALTLLDDTLEPDFTTHVVTTLLRPYMLDKASTQTIVAGDNSVVATLSGTGRWLSMPVPVPHWTMQTTWFVDASLGNDENSGATSLLPVKNVAEIARRLLQVNFVSYTINVAANVPSTDLVRFTPWVSSVGAGVASGGGIVANLNLVGARTALVTSVLTGATVTVPGTNTQATITDATTTWATYIGKMIVITSGVQVGAVAWVLADLGAGVAQVSEWIFPTTQVLAGAPLNLDTYQIVDMTTWAAAVSYAGLPARVRLNHQNFDFITGTNLAITDCLAALTTCRASGGSGVYNPTKNTNTAIIASCFTSATLQQKVLTDWGTNIFIGSCSINWQWGYRRTAHGAYTNTVLQGGYLTAGFFDGASGVAAADSGGEISSAGVRGLGVFSSTAAKAGISITREGRLIARSNLYGSGNATFGLEVKEGGKALIHSTITPTITGTTADVQIEGAATAIPELAGGAVVPAASALAAWGDWTGAPFTRNVVSYKTGSCIINVTG